jgi:purine-binding chemotaxis protein CheW
VIETMRPLPCNALLGVEPPVLGMSIIRGVATPVLDGGMLLGHAPTVGGRYVTVRAGSRTVAIAVDEVVGVRTLTDGMLDELPPLARAAGDAFEQIGLLDGELLVVLRGARLVPDAILATLEVPR